MTLNVLIAAAALSNNPSSPSANGLTREVVQQFLEGTRLKPGASPMLPTAMDKELSALFDKVWKYSNPAKGIDKVNSVEIEQIIVAGVPYRIDTPTEIPNIINRCGIADLSSVQFVARINGWALIAFPEADQVIDGDPIQPGQVEAPKSLSDYLGVKFNEGSVSGVIIEGEQQKKYNLGNAVAGLTKGVVIQEIDGIPAPTVDNAERVFAKIVKDNDSNKKKIKFKIRTTRGSIEEIEIPIIWGR